MSHSLNHNFIYLKRKKKCFDSIQIHSAFRFISEVKTSTLVESGVYSSDSSPINGARHKRNDRSLNRLRNTDKAWAYFPSLLMSRTPADNDLLLLNPGTIYHRVWPFFWTHAEWTVFTSLSLSVRHRTVLFDQKNQEDFMTHLNTLKKYVEYCLICT